LALVITGIVALASIKGINDRKQIVFIGVKKTVKNGPFSQIVWPHTRHEIRDAVRVTERQYAAVKHERDQVVRHVAGPDMFFMDAYEVLEAIHDKVSLQTKEYIRFIDKMTGSERVVKGPANLVPEPLEEAPKWIEQCIVIGATNAVLVEQKDTGMKHLITEPGMYVPEPYVEILGEQEAILLEPLDYAVVRDLLTGQARNELGPTLLQQGAYEEVVTRAKKPVLEKDEYIRLIDVETGLERIVTGPAMVVPAPTESAPDGIQKAIFLTSQTAVLVLNRATGQQRLETTPGAFVPQAYEKVIEARTKYLVLGHQVAVTRDVYGNMTMISGESGTNSFFLEPFTELVNMEWSLYDQPGIQEPVPKESVSFIDLRVQKMFFTKDVRTSDNVKLRLEGTIFWQVKDVLKMIAMTADPSGDVAQRAGSGLVGAVSKSTFAVFMTQFNNITAQAFQDQASDSFYIDRGLEMQSLELTKYDCVDEETALVLQLIIQESTNRINRLQSAQSENDVKAAKLVSDIELEKKRTELITTQAGNDKLEAELAGQADGAKLVESAIAFIDGLNVSVPEVEDRTDLYKLHIVNNARNNDTKNLANGEAKLFLLPKDMSVSLRMDKDEL